MKTFTAFCHFPWRPPYRIEVPILSRFRFLGEWFCIHRPIISENLISKTGFSVSHISTGGFVSNDYRSSRRAKDADIEKLKEAGAKDLARGIKRTARKNKEIIRLLGASK